MLHLFRVLSLLGLAGLCFVVGAAAIYFDLPGSAQLRKAFIGAQAWRERGNTSAEAPEEAQGRTGVTIDRPKLTWDGFTLYTSASGTWAQLLDMRGTVVHRWQMPFSRAWQVPTQVERPLRDDKIYWFRAHLYPNGDLLAVYQTDGDTPHGYGLAKIDKNSELIWTYSARVHHDVDVGEDGRIYTLTHAVVHQRPDKLNGIPAPYIADYLVVLSPRGKELKKIPILEAFRDSPFALTLASLTDPASKGNSFLLASPGMSEEKGDITHANSVKVLSRALAPRFRLFKPGQVLISLRRLNTLAVVDVETGAIVWAARGVWAAQHDAAFLENGRLLVYDNLGSTRGSRVLEYDPITQGISWSHVGANPKPFVALQRGVSQRFINGNTLIAEPARGRLFEVTSQDEIGWECYCPIADTPAGGGLPERAVITGARRYDPTSLAFLPLTTRARP
jgi:hypothetical protein